MLDPGRIPAGAAADSGAWQAAGAAWQDVTLSEPRCDVDATLARCRRESSVKCLILGAFLPVRRPAAAGGLIQNPNEILIAKPLYKTNTKCTFP